MTHLHPQANGQVGPLRQVSVEKASPYGAAGTVLWLCEQHAQEVALWNALASPSPKDYKDAIQRAKTTSVPLMQWPSE